MKPENALALIVAYYLSHFDREAYENLGFTTITEGHERIGDHLGVNPNTVKNMRDEFDSIHDNPRVGWYQREIRPSRQRVVEAFQDLGEYELRSIVAGILEQGSGASTQGLDTIIEVLVEAPVDERSGDFPYIVRGPTGRAAEEFFIDQYGKTGLPLRGNLTDTRDQGCGYDFEISSDSETVFVEVKGLKAEIGGVLFTAKEWGMAREHRERYYLALIRNLADQPNLEIIQNPAKVFSPRKAVTTTVQVRWQVGQDEITSYLAGS